MANRLRGNFLSGIVTSITAGNPATLTLASGLNIAIPSGYYLPIVLNPAPYSPVFDTSVLSEIVWTSGTYNAGTSVFTVQRAQEGTGSLGYQINIPYASGPTVQDFGILNGMINGDFPIPTASGQYLAASASGIGTVYWHQGTTVSTISGYQVTGNLSNATISGSQIVSPIALVNGSTATTQSALNDSAEVSTTAYTDAAVTVEKDRAEAEETTLANDITTLADNTIPKSNNNAVITAPIESVYTTSTPAGTTQEIDLSNGAAVILITSYATNNFTFNIRSTSGTSLDSLLVDNSSITTTILTTQGSTAYYCTGVEIDGTSQTVNWQGGSAPTSGNISGIDAYTIWIVKTATNTYTVLASLTQFAP